MRARGLESGLVLLAACSPARAQPAPPGCSPAAEDLAPGLRVERIRESIEPPVLGAWERCLTLVRVDPARFLPRLLTARVHGRARSATQWLEEFRLTGVVNASMFQDNGRSVGLMVDGRAVDNGADNPAFGGFLAFDPVSSSRPRAPARPRVAVFGRDCPGFDLASIRRDYRVVVQNYRLLDCDARPIAWSDPKVYGAAAVGVDRAGRLVLIHSRTPYRMRDLATMLAAPALDLRGALFVEGGPEASLLVRAGTGTVRAIGSYETGFITDDRNDRFWDLPNVIGF